MIEVGRCKCGTRTFVSVVFGCTLAEVKRLGLEHSTTDHLTCVFYLCSLWEPQLLS
jgi:hypothetical protein